MPQPSPLPVIHDGDHGSDDFVATLLLAARPDRFELLGVTTGFGNTDVDTAARNALAALHLAGRDDVPVFAGSNRPLVAEMQPGDDAFGANGIAGADFPAGPRPVEAQDAVAWLAATLRAARSPVTLCATGLMTNIARLIRDYPDTRERIAQIVAMGGCLGPLGLQGRRGNITPFAEFNFYQDPDAADLVLGSGLPVVLLPMDATHQTVLTPERQALMRAKRPGPVMDELIRMLRAAEHLDIPKFGTTGPVLHDENVPLYLLRPDLYGGRRVRPVVDTVGGERYGQLTVTDDDAGSVTLIDTIHDPDAVAALMIDTLARLDFQPRPAS